MHTNAHMHNMYMLCMSMDMDMDMYAPGTRSPWAIQIANAARSRSSVTDSDHLWRGHESTENMVS